MSSSDPREAFLRRYQADRYSHPAMVNHRGVVVAFAMGTERRLFYSVLNLNDGDSPFDVDHWSEAPSELPFPREVTEVGYGLGGETELPKMLLPSANNPVPVTNPEDVLPSEIDAYWSSTGRFTADAPFQVLTDDQHIFVFRQAVGREETLRTVSVKDSKGVDITEEINGVQVPVPLVNRTLLVDRYILSGRKLVLKREVRFRRSRSRTRPESSKDSLGAKDMDGNAFYEPTQELSFIRNLVKGRFTVSLLPTAVADLMRWEVFACSGATRADGTVDDNKAIQVIDSYNIERSAAGLFDARGTQIYTSPEPEYQSAVYERQAGVCPFTGRPLIPVVSKSGYAESALELDGTSKLTGSARGPFPEAWTVELWLKPNTIAGGETIFAHSDPAEGRLALNAAGELVYTEGVASTAKSTVSISAGAWTHVALAREAKDVVFYVNGEEAGTSILFPVRAAATTGIDFGEGFIGTLEEIREWDHCRHPITLAERKNNRLLGNEPGLVGYWRLDEGGGTLVRDQTDYEREATLVPAAGVDADTLWVQSTAPIGDNPGIRRSSFWIKGRDVVTGMSSVTYQESEAVVASSTGEARPLKQNTRVMLAVVSEPTDPSAFAADDNERKPLVCIIDFGVSREGRLALVRDGIELQTLPATFLSSLTKKLAGYGDTLLENARKIDPSATDRTPTNIGDDSDPVATITLFESNVRALQAWADDLKAATTPTKVRAAKDEWDQAKADRTSVRSNRTKEQKRLATPKAELDAAEGDMNTALGLWNTSKTDGSTAAEQKTLEDDYLAKADTYDTLEADYQALEAEVNANVAAFDAEEARLTARMDALDPLITHGAGVHQNASDTYDALQADADEVDKVGDARPMSLVDIDWQGLTTTGGRLDFAYTTAAPLLFQSATSEICLYFQGAPAAGRTDGQFFAAYYDTNTSRVSVDLPLDPPVGTTGQPDALRLRFYSRSTEPEREGATVAISAGATAGTCTVTIHHPTLLGRPFTEVWSEVPRAAGLLAEVINGIADTPFFLGTLAGRTWGTIDEIVLAGKVRRSLDIGEVVELGGVRTRVRAAAKRSDTRILVDSFTLPAALTSGVSVSLIPYDYATGLSRTGADIPGNGSALFRAVAGYAQGLAKDSSGACPAPTLLSQWVARSPGSAYRFDGTDLLSSATAADISRWETSSDVSIEAWVLPETLASSTGMIAYHESASNDAVPTYGMWLEESTRTITHTYYKHLYFLWFRWLSLPIRVQTEVEDPTTFHLVAQAGTRKVRSKDPIPYNRWNHFAAVYNHSFGVDLNGTAWLDAGQGGDLSVAGDLTLELFFRIDNVTSAGLITRGRFGRVAWDGVPYCLSVESGQVVFAFELPGGKRKTYKSTAVLESGRFYRLALVREHIRDTLETTKQVVIEYEDEDGDEQTRTVDVPDFETIEYDSIRMYLLEGRSTRATVIGTWRYGGEAAGDNRESTELGRASSDDGGHIGFDGAFAEARVWGRALTEDQVCRDGGVAGTESLVAWWRFDENRGRTTVDSAGENTITLYDGVAWVPSPDPNGPSLVLYRNGEVIRTDDLATDALIGQDQFSIGGRRTPGGTGAHLTGMIEEVRVWNGLRTREQIQDNMFTRLKGERTSLIAYHPFDKVYTDKAGDDHVADQGVRGNHLPLTGDALQPEYLLSTAPISLDTAQVRSALAEIHTDFHGSLVGRPGVSEYGDLQQDSEGTNFGVLKRCYTYVLDGAWHLVTGYKVGNLRAEWVGQVQFNPQVRGIIEGAPPVPSENLTIGPVLSSQSYAGRTEVELVRTDGTTYTLSSSSSSGYDLSFEAKASLGGGTSLEIVTAPLGFGTTSTVIDVSASAGIGGKVNAGASWSSEQTSASTIEIEQSTKLGLAGAWEASNDVLNTAIGPRWKPSNVGMALVQSETADVFALRLEHNNALVSMQFKPNPDIPPDWNILHFPVNPRYTKQGTLDGAVGYDARGKVLDPDYPTALDYGEYSYYKPREAYALKRRLERQQQSVRAYYEDFEPEPQIDVLGLMGDGLGVVNKALGGSGLSNPFADKVAGLLGSAAAKNRVAEDFSRRSFANTYVWTADGGFFSESTSVSSTFQETTGGTYNFSGELSASFSIEMKAPISVGFEMNMAMGGNLSYTRSKSVETESSVKVNVVCNNEGDLQRYGGANGLDGQYDPTTKEPILVPGKVDAYRFMTFFLEPDPNNYDDFFNKVVDPIWLEQSTAPNAIALRQARQDTTRPPCWRIFHRVTFVSRILPEFGDPAASVEETALKELDINSNYELVQRMAPFVAGTTSDYVRFSDAVRGALRTYFPELLPHQDRIVEYLALYYGVEEGMPDPTPTSGTTTPTTPSGATTLTGLAEDDGAIHVFPFSDTSGFNDVVGTLAAHVPRLGGLIRTTESGLEGALELEESGSHAVLEIGSGFGRSSDRTLEVVMRVSGTGSTNLLTGDPQAPANQRMFEYLAVGLGADGPILFKALPTDAPTPLPGFTRAVADGKLFYLAIGFSHASGEIQITWMVEGESQPSSIVVATRQGALSGGRVFVGNAQLTAAGFGPRLQLHHLAAYPSRLSSSQVLARIKLLAL